MKTIIVGCNESTKSLIREALKKVDWPVSEIVCSDTNKTLIDWAGESGLPIKVFETESDFYGIAAKQVRNARMSKYSDALIAIWDGKNQDTGRLISESRELGLQVVVFLESELNKNKASNPIKNNPVFGKQVQRQLETGKKESLASKTIELNGKRLVIYEDASRNQPILNIISELVDEVKKLKGET